MQYNNQGRRENSQSPGQKFVWRRYDVIIFKLQD